ncbi:hypothetical protein GTY20_29350 [Streptomyces sp. SID4946]|uniref:hypothetical protein n=1 Tax=Streptomyces sp. LamerLS-31b TaxID=1839765 RepID=UPI00081DBA3E|nr:MULTISPECIES: hypothetical protein [unclassified Streptomyces]MYQ95091.1 hypothetical protein [Streptomyces sp. SID4946]SCF61959.1 hypothetical protein GA0115258_104613 [Streptomyces sp. LamerLS-31b]SCF93497.1 hypothetical protein GA0115256_13489 [Streptomyces sp. DconLS]
MSTSPLASGPARPVLTAVEPVVALIVPLTEQHTRADVRHRYRNSPASRAVDRRGRKGARTVVSRAGVGRRTGAQQ